MSLPDTYYFKQVFVLLESYFEYDLEKCLVWLDAKNPNLGGVSAKNLFLLGRGEKVLKFCEAALVEETCGFCKVYCGKDYCVTRSKKR
jgi:hypothetical protein